MINAKIYKVEFSESLLSLDDKYINFDKDDLDEILLLDALSYLDYEDKNGNYICFIITYKSEIDKYTEVLNRNNINFTINDISEEILNSNYDKLDTSLEYMTNDNSVIYDIFDEDLYDWVYDNLDIDRVLDRINEVGLEHLNHIEQDFLENYKLD